MAVMELKDWAISTLQACREAGLMLATAESCTGGMVAAALTSVAGSSDVVERGFVTYSNHAKTEMLGVDAGLIAVHGAVSEPVAQAMAEGAVAHSRADIAIAITGIAGPSGGSPDKPVGLVHFACARHGQATMLQQNIFEGDRDSVREQAAIAALEMVREMAKCATPPASPP